MIYLTRRATFSASHYYWNDDWTAEKNEQVFGRCSNRNGHGHNYTLEVTVAGEPDPVTGFVVDLKWLKDVIEREVLAAWDHRHLNLEVEEFAEGKLIPTTENIAIAAWKRLEPAVTAAGQPAEKGRTESESLEKPPSGAKATVDSEGLTARLKSCPDTKPSFSVACGGAKLSRVRVYETPEIFAEYRGEL